MRKKIIIAGSILLILIIILFISSLFRKNNSTVPTTNSINNTSVTSPTGIIEKSSGSGASSNSIFNLFGLLGGSNKSGKVSPTPSPSNSSGTSETISPTASFDSLTDDPAFRNSASITPSTGPLTTYQRIVDAAEQKIKTIPPFENEHVKISYSPTLGKLIAVKKDAQADAEIRNWLKQNNLQGLENESQIIQAIYPSSKNITDPIIVQKLEFLKTHPYTSSDFTVTYDKTTDLFGVEQKTSNARKAFEKWAMDNGIFQVTDNRNIFVFTGTDKPVPTGITDKTTKPIEDLFGFIFAPPPTAVPRATSTPQPTNTAPIPSISSSPTQSPPTVKGEYVYYQQCDGSYDSIALTTSGGQTTCNVCNAGCGLVTTAMILSSFENSSHGPQYVVDYYRSKSYMANCSKGSDISSAKATLTAHNVKTQAEYTYISATDDITTSAKYTFLKESLKNGWTFFTNAWFYSPPSYPKCVNGCGHFLWITDIDDQGNVWAYDPFYGRSQAAPINLTALMKSKSYKVSYNSAFGVKPPQSL